MAMETQHRFRRERLHPEDGNERSLTELLLELRDETVRLFRQEIALAKTEVTDNAARAGRNVAYLAMGGLIAYAGALVLLMAAVVGLYVILEKAGLSHATAGWLSPLIIGGAVAAAGYVFIQKALTTLKHDSFAPERTIETMHENTNWIKEKVS